MTLAILLCLVVLLLFIICCLGLTAPLLIFKNYVYCLHILRINLYADNSLWRLVQPHITLTDVISGQIVSDNTSVHVLTDAMVTYKWLIRAAVGDKLLLNWTINCQRDSTATLYVRRSLDGLLTITVNCRISSAPPTAHYSVSATS